MHIQSVTSPRQRLVTKLHPPLIFGVLSVFLINPAIYGYNILHVLLLVINTIAVYLIKGYGQVCLLNFNH